MMLSLVKRLTNWRGPWLRIPKIRNLTPYAEPAGADALESEAEVLTSSPQYSATPEAIRRF